MCWSTVFNLHMLLVALKALKIKEGHEERVIKWEHFINGEVLPFLFNTGSRLMGKNWNRAHLLLSLVKNKRRPHEDKVDLPPSPPPLTVSQSTIPTRKLKFGSTLMPYRSVEADSTHIKERGTSLWLSVRHDSDQLLEVWHVLCDSKTVKVDQEMFNKKKCNPANKGLWETVSWIDHDKVFLHSGPTSGLSTRVVYKVISGEENLG